MYHAPEIVDFTVDRKGKKHPTQTGLNRAAVAAAKLKRLCTERRAPSKSDISHNKFVLLLHHGVPVSVLTGSTNFSEGAIFGHSNVVHVDNDPIIVSGSANFSDASSTDNDENMLIIRGDTRVADIYFGEFIRLYRHYAFRDWLTNAVAKGQIDPTKPIPVEWLDETNVWWKKYFGHTGYSNERMYLTK